MDGMKLEDCIADYVEGRADDAIRQAIDQRRGRDPDLDKQIRFHEEVLTALREAPKTGAPPGLSAKILMAVQREEKEIAAERKKHQREVLAAVSATGFLFAVLLVFSQRLMPQWASAAKQALAGWEAVVDAVSLLGSYPHRLSTALAFIDQDLQLPLLPVPLPLIYLVFTGLLLFILHSIADRTSIGY